MVNNSKLGIISFLGLVALLLTASYYDGAIHTIIGDMELLLTGHAAGIARGPFDMAKAIPVCLATIPLMLFGSIAAGIIQGIILGQSKKNVVGDLFERGDRKKFFLIIFILIILEEGLARYLFLGILPHIPFLSGTIAFYGLLIVGNGIWALMHLDNYAYSEDRHPLRVLPQFIGGLFLTVIFVKYGLWLAIMTHFAFDSVLFSLDKIQRVSAIDVMISGYTALCCGIAWHLMNKPITDIGAWFGPTVQFALPGWNFWDYLKLAVLFTGAFQLICDFYCCWITARRVKRTAQNCER